MSQNQLSGTFSSWYWKISIPIMVLLVSFLLSGFVSEAKRANENFNRVEPMIYKMSLEQAVLENRIQNIERTQDEIKDLIKKNH